jgi:hypothetical protein
MKRLLCGAICLPLLWSAVSNSNAACPDLSKVGDQVHLRSMEARCYVA